MVDFTPLRRLRVQQVQPFTYRDGITFLELLERLATHVKDVLEPSLKNVVDDLVEQFTTEMGEHRDAYVEGVEEFQRIHDAFMADVNANLMALNDTAVTSLVEDETSLLGQILRQTFEPEGEVRREVYDRMGVITPQELTTAALQEAADIARDEGKRLVASGVMETSEQLTLECDADLRGLTINYSGGGTAVQIGVENTSLQNKLIHAPLVRHSGNQGTHWADVLGTIGVRVVNMYASRIHIPYASRFHTGVLIEGLNNNGCSYNSVYLGTLFHNQYNFVMDSDGEGWVTENVYHDGRFAHDSSAGTDLADVEQILIKPTDHPSRNATSNNVFIKPSVEGVVARYQLSVAGQYNTFINARMEVPGRNPRVRFQNRARYNTFINGFGVENAKFEFDETSSENSRISPRGSEYFTSGSERTIRRYAITDKETGEQLWFVSPVHMEGRAFGDAFPRIEFRFDSGRILLGDGTAEPTSALLRGANNSLILDGDTINTKSTADIGGSINRPRHIKANTSIVPGLFNTADLPSGEGLENGAMVVDRDRGKLLIWMGYRWIDAMGNDVV